MCQTGITPNPGYHLVIGEELQIANNAREFPLLYRIVMSASAKYRQNYRYRYDKNSDFALCIFHSVHSCRAYHYLSKAANVVWVQMISEGSCPEVAF